MVFGFLCLDTKKPGGPQIYAKMIFGEKIAFFVTWLYWCGAWVCNPILISASIDYLEQVIGPINVILRFLLEITIIISLTALNIKGIKSAGMLETIMVVIKLFPLFLVPILSFYNINFDNFSQYNNTTNHDMSYFNIIIQSSMVAFWGFVGLEEGGSITDSIINAKKNVPLAIILGTSFVAMISLINTICIFGIIPCEQLKDIKAPFAIVLGKILDGSYDKIIGILTFLMCYGSLNAWILFSGKLSQTAAEENIFPKFFGKKNINEAPYVSLYIAAIGTIIILGLLEFTPYKNTMSDFLEMSIIMYVVLYLIAIASYIVFIYKKKRYSVIRFIIAILAFIFCIIILIFSDYKNFIAVGLVLLTSLPVYYYNTHNRNNITTKS